MTAWTIGAAWLLGWLLAVRPAMRRQMLEELCTRCGRTRGDAHDPAYGLHDHPEYRARGAWRERNGRDVAWAVFAAAWWPTHLLGVALLKLTRRLGAGIKTAVVRATPLTAPELERRIAERDEEIDRLTKQIGEVER